VLRDTVSKISQADAGATPVVLERQDAVDEDVRHHHRIQCITQSGCRGEFGPGDGATVGAVLGAVAQYRLPAVIEAECDSRQDVGGDGDEDEEWFEGEGLVEGPCEEEGVVGGGQRLRDERDHGCVGVVHEEVDGGGDGGVFLQGV
jgi:hypothetical protein